MARTFKNIKISEEVTPEDPSVEIGTRPPLWQRPIPTSEDPKYLEYAENQRAHAEYLENNKARIRHEQGFRPDMPGRTDQPTKGDEDYEKELRDYLRLSWRRQFVKRHGVDPIGLDRDLKRKTDIRESFGGPTAPFTIIKPPNDSPYNENGAWRLPNPDNASVTEMTNLFEHINQDIHQPVEGHPSLVENQEGNLVRRVTGEGDEYSVPTPITQPRTFPSLESFLSSGDPVRFEGNQQFPTREGDNSNFRRRVVRALLKNGKERWEDIPREKAIQEGWDIMSAPGGVYDQSAKRMDRDTCYPFEDGLDYEMPLRNGTSLPLKHYVRHWRQNYYPAGTGLVQHGVTNIEDLPKTFDDRVGAEHDANPLTSSADEFAHYQEENRVQKIKDAAGDPDNKVVIHDNLVPNPETASDAEHLHFRKNVLGIPEDISDEEFLKNTPTYVHRDPNSDEYGDPLTGALQKSEIVDVRRGPTRHPHTFGRWKKFAEGELKKRVRGTRYEDIELPPIKDPGSEVLDIDDEGLNSKDRFETIEIPKHSRDSKQLDFLWENQDGQKRSYQEYLMARQRTPRAPEMISNPELDDTDTFSRSVRSLVHPDSRDNLDKFTEGGEQAPNLLSKLLGAYGERRGRPFIVDLDSLDHLNFPVNLKKTSGDSTSELTPLSDVVERHLRAQRLKSSPGTSPEDFYRKPSDLSQGELNDLIVKQTGGLHNFDSFVNNVNQNPTSAHFPIDVDETGRILPLRTDNPRGNTYFAPAPEGTVTSRSLHDYVKASGLMPHEEESEEVERPWTSRAIQTAKGMLPRMRKFLGTPAESAPKAQRFIGPPDLGDISQGSSIKSLSTITDYRRHGGPSYANNVPILDTDIGGIAGVPLLRSSQRDPVEVVGTSGDPLLSYDGFARCKTCHKPSYSSHLDDNGNHFGEYLKECNGALTI